MRVGLLVLLFCGLALGGCGGVSVSGHGDNQGGGGSVGVPFFTSFNDFSSPQAKSEPALQIAESALRLPVDRSL